MLKAFVPISKILKASAAAGGRKNERTLIPVQTTLLQLDSSEVSAILIVIVAAVRAKEFLPLCAHRPQPYP